MSTNLKQIDDELNQRILTGKIFEAMERFYAPDCVMQENTDAPCVGLPANIEREKQFFALVQVVSQGIGEGVTFGEWVMDVTMKGAPRAETVQVSRRSGRTARSCTSASITARSRRCARRDRGAR